MTDRISAAGNAIASIRLSVRLFPLNLQNRTSLVVSWRCMRISLAWCRLIYQTPKCHRGSPVLISSSRAVFMNSSRRCLSVRNPMRLRVNTENVFILQTASLVFLTTLYCWAYNQPRIFALVLSCKSACVPIMCTRMLWFDVNMVCIRMFCEKLRLVLHLFKFT